MIPLCFATPACVELSASDQYQRTAQAGRGLKADCFYKEYGHTQIIASNKAVKKRPFKNLFPLYPDLQHIVHIGCV